MIKISGKIFISIFTLFFLIGENSVLTAQDQIQLPSFRIRSLSGDLFDSRKHLGKPLVLSFFYTRCPPCIKEMPVLYEYMLQEGRVEQLLFVDSYVKALNINDVPDTERQIRKFVFRCGAAFQLVFLNRQYHRRRPSRPCFRSHESQTRRLTRS